MSDPKPTRTQGDLAEMLEMLLDKGVVVNADIAVSIGDTELLGIQLRAAIASFETAAAYGLEFPTGTSMERAKTAADISPSASDAEQASQSVIESEDDLIEEDTRASTTNPSRSGGE